MVDAEAAEAAGVDEADLALVVQSKDGMSMRRERDIVRRDQQPPSHAQVDEEFGSSRRLRRLSFPERPAAVGILFHGHDDGLADAAHLGDARASERIDDLRLGRLEGLGFRCV